MAGALAQRGFGLLFAVDAATCLASAAIVWRHVPADTAPPASADLPERLRDVLADRLMVAFCLVTALEGIVDMQSFSTLPPAMRADA